MSTSTSAFDPSTPDLSRASLKRRASPPPMASPSGMPLSSGSVRSGSSSGPLEILSRLPRRALIRIGVVVFVLLPTLTFIFSLPSGDGMDMSGGLGGKAAGAGPEGRHNAAAGGTGGAAGAGKGTRYRERTGSEGAGAYAYGYGPVDMARRVRDWGSDWTRSGAGSSSSSSSGGGDRGQAGEDVKEKDEYLDLEEEMLLTTYDGGIAGYSVFSNLYLSSGALLFVGEPETESTSSSSSSSGASPAQAPLDPGAERRETPVEVGPQPLPRPIMPATRQIMSGPKRPTGGYPAADEERWRVVDEDVAIGELGKRAVYLKGLTYIFNDGPGGDGYLVYFRHFVLEAFLGATRVLAHVLGTQNLLAEDESMAVPDRVMFPRCGWQPSWRDDRGENAWFLHHALPGVSIEDSNGWSDRSSVGLPVIFERAVIIDRWSAHSVPGDVAKWGKMNAGVLPLPTPRSFWRSIRENVMRSLGVDDAAVNPSKVGSRGLPVVVYVDSQSNNPRLSDSAHSQLIEGLKSLIGIAEVHVTRLSAMTRAQQVDLMGWTEIVISLHSDDLFGALWMPATERSAVIELFEDGGFDRSFELLASSLNHKYIAVQNDKTLSEDEWRAIGAKRGDNAKGQLEVDAELIVRTVRTLLGLAPREDLSAED